MKKLPGGWTSASFSAVATIASNLVDPSDWGGLPHIAPDNIERDTGRLLPFRSIAEDKVRSPKHHFRSGQILYSKIRPYLNKCVRARFEGLCSADMYPIDAVIDPEYLRHYMLSSEFVTGVSQAAGSRTVLPKTNQEQMASVPVPVAPLPEQHRIVAAIDDHFSRLDEAVDLLERVQRNLKRYRASVLKAAVEGRLVPTEAALARAEGRTYEPASVLLERILEERRRRWKAEGGRGTYKEPVAPDTTDLPGLPEGWSWATVDQLGLVTGGLTKNAKRDIVPTRLPYLRVANVYANELRLDQLDNIGVNEAEIDRVLLRTGDLLVVEGNGSIEQIGRVALWDGSIEPCVHQNHIIKVRFDPVVLASWVLTWLLSPGGRYAIQVMASSTSGLHTLSISKVASLPVPLCPIAEQERLRMDVDRLLSLADGADTEAAKALSRCARLRQSILKWAFEGRLADQDPTDEPASVLLDRIRAERGAAAAHKTARWARHDRRREGT